MRCQPALIRVSRQIDRRTLLMFYGMNEFVAYTPGGGEPGQEMRLSDAHKILKAIGKRNAACIKHVAVLLADCMSDYNLPCLRDDLGFDQFELSPKAVKVLANSGGEPQYVGVFIPIIEYGNARSSITIIEKDRRRRGHYWSARQVDGGGYQPL
ncbi:hypothetical protein DOTSEDRAFT_26300 [Dothistroma septosporum NZE10]|uniref:Uncharacterized protein n=1 Tax=Dothistroma septosporum (strain NZE10 / CBS 128990) TaxID=675120 RepID=N1PJK0_DOTSN|nr:hypothetical protein DOTSEDRAFT_26300 [Dothistroma septosporum NZE10]